MRTCTPRMLGAVVASAAVGIVAALAAPAAGGEPCWQAVINDWADNERVDGRYPIHCYQDALRKLPEDMRAYSSAPEDIERAMRAEIAGQAQDSSTESETDDDGASGGSAAPPSSGAAKPDAQSRRDQSQGEDQSTQAPPAPPRDPDPDDDRAEPGGVFRQALDEVGPKDATSVPLPLLVIGGLLAMLLIAGGLGYVARRGPASRLRLGRR